MDLTLHPSRQERDANAHRAAGRLGLEGAVGGDRGSAGHREPTALAHPSLEHEAHLGQIDVRGAGRVAHDAPDDSRPGRGDHLEIVHVGVERQMLHRPDPSVRAALIPDVDHVVAGHEIADLETAFGVDRHRPLPEAGRGAAHAHRGDAEPRDAVAARVHHLAPHAHEPGRGQREVDVVEIESGVDAQRLALFLHAHAGVERGHVGGGIGPFGRRQRLADVGAHVVVARRGHDAIHPVLGGLCERGRGPPAAEQGTAHGLEHDFDALQRRCRDRRGCGR